MVGLYIHIPFCKKKCPYCDFYSIPYQERLAYTYIDILIKQIKNLNYKISTVYIGGGTPSVLRMELLNKLLKYLTPIFRSSKENTIEVNPESLDKDKIKLFLKRGINRLSIGVQSLDDSKLRFLGRIHSSRMAINAIEEAKRCGFKNISVDLIYGLPKESLSNWRREVKEIVKFPIQHISCYALSCEPKTRFYKFKNKISEEEVTRMYIFNMRFLPKKGFYQYEVSNFSLEGFECLHNLNYWYGGEYLGLGPSAASFIKGERTKNIVDIKEYIERVKIGGEYVIYREKLNLLKRAKELVSLMIRTKEGIDIPGFRCKTGFDFFRVEEEHKIKNLQERGFIKLHKKKNTVYRISLTEKGFLFCDEVSSEFV
jgi:oxygen-independent coproporphyrinogen-3 oxidase